MEQNTIEWLEIRKKHIGASDAPVIMKVSPWRTPFQLWEEKLGIGVEQGESSAMRYGKENEEIARRSYETYTNNVVIPEVVFHPTRKYAMASLDGLTVNGDIILEVKNANRDDHDMARQGRIPPKYFPQLQHQLDCVPGAVLHYWSFHDGDGALVEIDRDFDYIKDLITEEGKFWGLVQSFEAPELIDKDYFEFVGDEQWDKLIEEARYIAALERKVKLRKDANREAIMGKCNGRSAKGCGARFTKTISQGRVDYSAIPELIGVDLSAHRKPSSESWRLTFEKK